MSKKVNCQELLDKQNKLIAAYKKAMFFETIDDTGAGDPVVKIPVESYYDLYQLINSLVEAGGLIGHLDEHYGLPEGVNGGKIIANLNYLLVHLLPGDEMEGVDAIKKLNAMSS